MTNVATPGLGSGSDERSRMLERISQALTRAARSHARAGVIVAQADAWRMGAERIDAVCRLQAVLGLWQRYRRDCVHVGSFGGLRAGVVIAPIGYASHAEEIAEQLARAIDPRSCPLLRESTPCVWYGTSLFPDDGVEAQTLLLRAQEALEERLHARHIAPTAATGVALTELGARASATTLQH